MKSVTLKKNEDRRITRGHLWAFSNEIASIDGTPSAGEIVELKSHSSMPLGKGFYHPHSLIAVRLLTRTAEPVDDGLFQRRIEAALALRQALYPASTCYRVIHGESDFLPGLVADRYGDTLVLQVFAAGMEERLPLICDILESLVHPHCIIERNEMQIRELEGLPMRKGVIRGTLEPVVIEEEGLRYEIDPLGGQKTGFFLDQRENRRAIRRFAAGRKVLDCFCNDGGFALNAAAAGAVSVTGVDIAEDAIGRARKNAGLNALASAVKFEAADAFDALASAVTSGERYDLVILDPPSFAKNRKTIRKAIHGYRALHRQAFRLINEGGFLATASCSHHLYEDTFIDIVNEAAREATRTVSLLEWHGAAPDHPILPAMPETEYLKFGIFRVV